MKRNLIFAFAAIAFVVLVAGCGGANTADIDAMEYGNAPELGNIVKNYKLAQRNQDWGSVYDMLPKKAHENWEESLKKKAEGIKEVDTKITAMEKKVEAEKDEKKKEYYGMALEWMKEQKAKVESIETARDIYIYSRNINSEIVVGERIDSNDGYIIYLNLSTGETRERKQLVKEEDQWKFAGNSWD